MDTSTPSTPRRRSSKGRLFLVLFIGLIAAAYAFLPEEGGSSPGASGPGSSASGALLPAVGNDNGRVNQPASIQGVHLVDFWAEWCGPCKIQDPIIARVAQQYAGRMQFSKVDVDARADLAQQFGVQGVPTIIIFKDGQEAARFVGVTDEVELQQTIAGLVR